MNQSENINELATALSKAQSIMEAALKDATNPFFKSKYANLESVWSAARPALCANGLCIIQTTEEMGDKTVLVTMLAHSSGQWIKSRLPLNPSKNDAQGMGSAMSYARRYSLSAMVGVVAEDDDGESAVGRGSSSHQTKKPNAHQEQEYIPEPKKLSKEQLNDLQKLWDQVDDTCKINMTAWMKSTHGARSFDSLPEEAYVICVRGMTNNIEGQKHKKATEVNDEPK